jgi:FixJ family two-component response regulator
MRNKQIAYELGLAEKTVKMHRGITMEKLGVRTAADMIRLAVEAGI